MKDKNGVGFIKTFDYSNHKFNFGQFLRSPIKLKKSESEIFQHCMFW